MTAPPDPAHGGLMPAVFIGHGNPMNALAVNRYTTARRDWASVPVGDVTSAKVRAWHTSAAKTVRSTALAQSYRLLRSILGVAATDEVIASNPCKVRGAGTPKPARPGPRGH